MVENSLLFCKLYNFAVSNPSHVLKVNAMKRIISIILLFSFTTGLFAQKWLKGIGKVLNTVEKGIHKLPDNRNKQSGQRHSAAVTFTYGDAKGTTSLPNFTIIIENVKRIGQTDGAVYLTLINTSGNPVRIYDWQNISELVDSEGNSYADYGKWELQIGDCKVRRYGTDGDYVFPAGKKVNAVFYITDLNGKVTTRLEKGDSIVKTIVKAPAVIIDNLVLNPSIVYQEENIRRNYTIEISNLKIPAYVHIDRTGLEKESTVSVKEPPVLAKENAVLDTIRSVDNPPVRNEEPGKDSPLHVNVPENMVAVDSDGNEPLDKKEEPEINLPEISYVKLTKEFFRDAIKEVLAKKSTYTLIRRGVFFTNEKMQGNPLNYSYSLYKAMHDLGAFRIQNIDASKWVSNGSRMSNSAKAHSSYPMVGTKCITITHIDKNLTRGLRKASYGPGAVLAQTNVGKNETGTAYDMNNIATYEFPNEFCELSNISDMEAHQFQNGNINVTLVCDVVENPSDFKVALMKAYNKAYTPVTGRTYDIPQSQKITMAFDFHFDAAKKKWSYKRAYKKNKETNKFDVFYE